ncbi:ketopantoate reductase family protein [Cryobacterium sp. BB736]|uniref:ketopantoate reductase family protein n=1 Tax=Cryobacterium sp. BB736 TaxID=2746963 RepID=UPI0018770949|nr:2-dehydropantoate 2-reductase [Cryobacterium sp. BB736]
MRVGVIGAGAVGGVIAALLDRGGHDVEVTTRGDGIAAIRDRGLTLTGSWGEHVARPAVGERLTRSPDLAVVTTKALDARDALLANAEALRGIPVLVVQNGLRGVETATEVLPDSEVIGGLALYAASYVKPGEVTVTNDGSTYIGGASHSAVRLAAQVIGGVMPVSVTDNFAGAQWTKLVVNQINALPAITGLSAQATIARRQLRHIMTRSMRENVRVGYASNVRFESLQGLTPALLWMLAHAPIGIAQVVPALMARRMGPVPNPGSTLQSLRRGQPTEVDYLNGAVVDAGRKVSLPTPVNAALVELVHEVERTGRHLSPQEVIARVG